MVRKEWGKLPTYCLLNNAPINLWWKWSIILSSARLFPTHGWHKLVNEPAYKCYRVKNWPEKRLQTGFGTYVQIHEHSLMPCTSGAIALHPIGKQGSNYFLNLHLGKASVETTEWFYPFQPNSFRQYMSLLWRAKPRNHLALAWKKTQILRWRARNTMLLKELLAITHTGGITAERS